MTLRPRRTELTVGLLPRLLLLYGGLVIGGVGFSMFVVADLGLDPWDVLHQGVSRSSGFRLGTVVALFSLAALLVWIPLRQRPGLGTLSDVVVVGLVIDASLAIMPRSSSMVVRVALLLTALALNGLGTSMYIGARLGPGPRDGLMTGLASKGLSIRRSRVMIDVTVVGLGWLIGGTVGVGTVASMLTIGPIVHYLLPRIAVVPPTKQPPRVERRGSSGGKERSGRNQVGLSLDTPIGYSPCN